MLVCTVKIIYLSLDGFNDNCYHSAAVTVYYCCWCCWHRREWMFVISVAVYWQSVMSQLVRKLRLSEDVGFCRCRR